MNEVERLRIVLRDIELIAEAFEMRPLCKPDKTRFKIIKEHAASALKAWEQGHE